MSGIISDNMLKLFASKIKSINQKQSDQEDKVSQEFSSNQFLENNKISEQNHMNKKSLVNEQEHEDQSINVQNQKSIPSAIKKEKAVQKLPKVYFMNNLLKLSNSLNYTQIEKLALIQAQRCGISYAKIMLCFGIQKFIYNFYQHHDINMKINQRYAFQEIQRYVNPFIQSFKIKDRLLLSKIVKGACKRFRCDQFYSERWLTNKIAQKRKSLQNTGINVNQLQQISKSRLQLEDTKNYFYKPLKKQLIPINYKRMYPQLQLEDRGQQVIESPETYHNKRQLFFWFKKQISSDDSLGEEIPQSLGNISLQQIQDDQSQESLPIQKDFQIIITWDTVPNEKSILSVDSSEPQPQEPQDYGQIQEYDNTKYHKKGGKSEKKQIKKQLAKLKTDEEISKFKIKITPQQINKIVDTMENNLKKTIKQLSSQIKLSETNISFVFQKKEDYKKIISSKNTALMQQNSIIVEKKKQKPSQNKYNEDFDDETVLELLDLRMKKYLQKTKETNIKLICSECQRTLGLLSVSKDRQKLLVKNWIKKFIGRS